MKPIDNETLRKINLHNKEEWWCCERDCPVYEEYHKECEKGNPQCIAIK